MSDFLPRHIGPNREEQMDMLAQVGATTLEDLVAQVRRDRIERVLLVLLERERHGQRIRMS